jgi:hypothetical protein
VRQVLLRAVEKYRGTHVGSLLDDMFEELGEREELHALIIEKWGAPVLTLTEHITSAELAAHRQRMARQLRICRFMTSAQGVCGLCAGVAALFGAYGVAWAGLCCVLAWHLVWLCWSWRIEREQGRVMLALLADIAELNRQTNAQLGKAE